MEELEEVEIRIKVSKESLAAAVGYVIGEVPPKAVLEAFTKYPIKFRSNSPGLRDSAVTAILAGGMGLMETLRSKVL